MTHRMLIAGIGNIFLRDDGFGAEVARRLASADLPDWVRVADYGISGMHLAYDMADGYETTILVDAAARGGEPGTVYLIEPEQGSPPGAADKTAADKAAAGAPLTSDRLFDAHGMQPDVVFRLVQMLGAEPGRVLVVGCEPVCIEQGIGLSAPVTAAVDEAVRIVTGIIGNAADAADAERLQTPVLQAPQARAATPQVGSIQPARVSGRATERWSHVPRHTR